MSCVVFLWYILGLTSRVAMMASWSLIPGVVSAEATIPGLEAKSKSKVDPDVGLVTSLTCW